MFLEIDMGNSRVKWRFRDANNVLDKGFIETTAEFDLLAAFWLPYAGRVTVVWVASVVSDDLEQKLAEWVKCIFAIDPIFARSGPNVGVVQNGYDSPDLLGVDRWLSILAAYGYMQTACIVLSLGTAATIDVIDKNGRHLGGFIAPGLSLMIRSLSSSARRISANSHEIVLTEELGRATSLAICGGCTSMLEGLVDNAVKQLRKVAGDEHFELVFTGGDAIQLMPYYPSAHLINDLVMDGLAYALQESIPGCNQ